VSEDLSDDLDLYLETERTVASLMSDEILIAAATTTLRDAAVSLDDNSVSLMVIGSRAAVEGVISERDIVAAVAAGMDLDTTTVADVETKQLKWATPESTVADVAEEMMENYVRHVLVGEAGSLVGVVSMRDLFAAFLA
jgi:CBS domain-containing protein